MSEIAKRIIEEVLAMADKLPKEDEGLQEAMSDVEQAVDELIAATLAEKNREIERLRGWVNDLHSGMYINCVYCGHRYGPDPETPVAMADILKTHIEQCPEHPLSAMKADRDRWKARAEQLAEIARDWMGSARQARGRIFGPRDGVDYKQGAEEIRAALEDEKEIKP